jgi:phosphatidylglycerol:prolipoprotein diacylglycerol transferase
MAGVIPFFTIEPIDIFGLKLQPFGILVATGVLFGAHLVRRYAEKHKLDLDVIQTMTAWTVIPGFLGAHFFDLIFYHPENVAEDPLIIIKLWAGISSVGGMLGGLIGFSWYHHRVRKKPEDILRYSDAALYGIVPAWVFGRVGCTIVQDHPGAPSDFPLAMTFKDGVARHNLGFYEMLWLVVIATVIFIIARNYKSRPAGFIAALAPTMYGPGRFMLDFLRAPKAEGGDIRYLGLTPAHYVSIGFAAMGALLLWYAYARRQDPVGDYVEPDPDDGDGDEVPPKQAPPKQAPKKKKHKKRK